jgi:3-deoxy-manno-octulosonate cytidylyltransferase (CMP-KDO synthetase)
VTAIIPARYGASRLPGKVLLDIAGRPMIAHVLERVRSVSSINRVIVATDDHRIVEAVKQYDGEAVLTSPTHQSGTDRVAEVAATLDSKIIVNVQADEPFIDPGTIEVALTPVLRNKSIVMSTTSEPIDDPTEVCNPNVVKVVTDCRGFALYFSRLPIPYAREAASGIGSLENTLKSQVDLLGFYRKHTGLYVYQRETLLKLAQLTPSPLEQLEKLEQLRALEHGIPILVVPVNQRSIGVDTLEDLQRVRNILMEAKRHG